MSGLLVMLVINLAGTVDLFVFQEAPGRVLAFAGPKVEPIPTTVDQAGATHAAITWARRFYHLTDLDVLAVEFKTRPTRFWRVTFLTSNNGRSVRLFAVILPDGHPVEPIMREET